MVSADERTAVPKSMRSGVNACSLRVGSRASSSLTRSSLHHLRVVFAQGIDLTNGEAVGIDVGHVALFRGWNATNSGALLVNTRLHSDRMD